MKKRILILLLIVFTSICAWSQMPKDTLLASQYFKTADSLLTEKRHDESIVLFKKARLIYQEHKMWEHVAACYNKISSNKWRSLKLQSSLEYAEKALSVCNTYSIGSGEKAISYDNIGHYYKFSSNYKDALIFFEKAYDLRLKQHPKNRIGLAESNTNIAFIYYIKSNYEAALQHAEKALSYNLKEFGSNHHYLISNYNNLAIIYNELQQFKKALNYYNKSLTLSLNIYGRNYKGVISLYNNIGLIHSKLKQYDKALPYFEKVLKIGDIKNNPNNLISVYNNLGVVFENEGKYDKAILYFKRSLDVTLKNVGEKYYKVGGVYNNIGQLNKKKGEYQKALVFYKKALQNHMFSFGRNNFNTAEVLNNIGAVYVSMGDYDLALKYHEEALRIFNKIFGNKNYKVAITYGNLAMVYFNLQEYKKALFYYNKGLNSLQKLYGEKYIFNSEFYYDIASVYNKQKKYTLAIIYFDKAITRSSEDDGHLARLNLYDNSFYDSNLLIKILYGKAQTYKSVYDQNQDLTSLQNSINTYKQADTLIQTMRQSFTNYQDKLTFSKTAKEIYEGAIAAQLVLYEVEKDQKSLEQAFYYAEKSKANTLKELLTDANAKKFTGLPEDLIALEKELRIEKSFYKSSITEELSNKKVDSTKISTFENELFRVNRSQDSLIDVLEQNYPKYYELKYQNSIVTVANIQQQLDDQTTVVEFFTSDSTTYAFTISKEAIGVKTLHTKELTKKIETFRSQVIEKDLQQYKQQAYELYTTLIAPIRDQLKGDQLLIIPDGSLWHLNFDLLLIQKPTSNNPADLPYLLRDYAISYGNSANLLFSENTTTSTDVSKLQECLAFSFSDSTQVVDASTMTLATLRDTGDDLPGTRVEIRAISEIIDGAYYYGSQAIEKNFKDKASQYNILHLALHGEVDNEHPENSRLYFTKSKDTLEDNLLYSHELFAMDIPAELTVLSACNTGSGKIAKGEGIMSLGSAFQYAGSKSLLLTNWSVSDRTTPELIQYFYKNLKEGMNKSKALQQAKLTYIKEADIHSRDPFYWGSFYLVGDTSAMHFEDNTLLYWVVGLGAIGLLVLIVLWYLRKVKKMVN